MKTVQVVLEAGLLRDVDRATKRLKVNRSALVRDALRLYLTRLQVTERERRDRAGYERRPDRDLAAWDKVASWPAE